MKMKCPHGCGAKFSIMENTCPRCRKPSGAMDVIVQSLRILWHGLWGGKGNAFKADCPNCKQPFPLTTDQCPACGTDVGAFSLISGYASPLVATLLAIRSRANRATPFEAWAIRFGYCLASGATLWLLLGAAERKFVNGTNNWISPALATCIYVGLSISILTWFLPRNLGPLLAQLKLLIKLSLLANYFSTVLTVLFITDHWRTRSWLLIGILILSMVGVWFASRFIVPAWATAGAILAGKNPHHLDPNQRGPNKNHFSGRFP